MRTFRLAALLVCVCVIVGAGGAIDLAVRAQAPQDVGTWASIGALPDARSGAAAVALEDGRTLVAGGRTADGTVTDTVVVFDPATKQTTTVGRLIAPRVGHTATLIAGGRVLVVGGTTDGAISADVESLDLASGASTLVATLAQPRTGHAAAALANGKVLIAGGTTVDNVVLQTAEIFDPENLTVVPTGGSLQVARSEASATTLLDGRVLIVGGSDGAHDLASAELFDAATESFNPLAPENHLSAPRSGHTAILLPHNNGVLIAGGRSNGTAVSAADLFVPPIFPDPYTFGVGRFAGTGSLAAARSNAVSAPGPGVGYALALGGGPTDAEAYRFATIQTDKDDYAPGERATITGTGWQPGADVTLMFQEDPAVHDDYVLHVTADTAGNIYWDQWAPEQHDLNVRFYLTAVDSKSHVQITFTDSQPGQVSVSPTPISIASGTSAIYQVKVARSGNSNACTIILSATYTSTAPNGTTFSFAQNPLIMTTADVLTNLTITTTNSGAPAAWTRPGSYAFAVAATPSGCQNNTVSSGNGTLIVTASPTTLTAAAATATYGGSTDLSATLVASGTGVSGKTITFTLSGTSVGNATTNASGVATLASVSLAGINVGTYGTAVGASFAGDAVTQASSGSSSLTVTKADVTVTMTGYAGVYDGNPHGATGTATGARGEDLSSLLSLGSTFTTVPGGTATWNFAGNGNYNPKSGSANITISKADANVTVNGYTGAYDADPHGATGAAAGVKGEDLTTLLNLGGSFTNVPGGTASWTFAGNGNYNSKNGTANIAISKADAAVTVNNYSGVYDGNPHGVTGTATGVKAEDLSSLLNLGASFTNVPGGTANWTFAGNGNYNSKNGTANVAIAKADATITVNPYTGIYDGEPHKATGSAKGVKSEDLTTLLNLGDSFSDAPGGTATWTFAGNTNYNAATGSASVAISKADATVMVTGYTGIYDGDTHGATGSAKGVKGEDLSGLLNLGSNFTNAPGGTASWTFAGNGNYNAANGSATIVISQANATVTVDGYTGVYDGNAHGATGHATGVKGEDLSSLLNVGATFTNAPGGTATWNFAGNNNYNPANGFAIIVISQADASVTVTGYSGLYDGGAHGAKGSAKGVNGEDLSNLLNLGQSFTDAPGGTATWTFAGNTNYNSTSGLATIAISKTKATIVVDGYTGIYDGHAHKATGSATGVKGEDLSSMLDLGASFTSVPGGTAAWSFTGNINYDYDNGTVAIVISQATANITVNGYTGIYDGNAHGATGQAVGVQGEDLSGLLNLGANFTNVPGGTATWAFAGDTNYKSAGGTVLIAISKANATIKVDGYNGVYDGAPHGAGGYVKGVKGEDLTSLLNIVGSFTDVPGGTATWSFAGNGNYSSSTGTASIVITKATQVIAWGNPAPIVYGTPLGSAQLNATLTTGAGALTYSPTAGTVLPVGSQILQVTAAATTNYYAASAQVTVQVTPWYATGFYKPVTMGGSAIVNTVKGGSTVPLKFNLYTSVNGTELTGIDAITGFQVFPMSCGATTYEDPIDFTTTGGTSLRYDPVERQFIQNWQTPKSAGACYKVAMTAKDGSSLVAFFKTK